MRLTIGQVFLERDARALNVSWQTVMAVIDGLTDAPQPSARRSRPRRVGKAWLKLKHALTLNLVVVAAEWGYGRQHGRLSNYHLATRNAQTGEYQVVGKTFKGLTDAGFQAMTERLLRLERSRKGSTVFVWPEVVGEMLFNEVQTSLQYRSGLALRFARIFHVREDKAPGKADTVQALRHLYER